MYDNVFEVESEAIAAMACETSVSGLVAFDIAAAFPSLCHSFLFQMLHRYDIPDSLINLVKGLYKNHSVMLKFKGRSTRGSRWRVASSRGALPVAVCSLWH